jgi:hypothetical protein
MPHISPETEKITTFLEEIGIKVVEKDLDDTTFLPGLALGPNILYVDYSKLKYPGDLLHEAGHIAVTAPHDRSLIGTNDIPDTWPTQGDEIVAILWSYAALTHLGLPPDFVFHSNGYKGHSQWYIDSFTQSNYIGLPLLQWLKMTPSEEEVQQGKPAFPAMKNWVRTE